MKNRFLLLQIFAWTISFLLFFFYLQERLRGYEIAYVAGITIAGFVSYACIIYGYVYFIYPRYHKGRTLIVFSAIVVGFFVLIVAIRVVAEVALVAPLTKRDTLFTFGLPQILYDLISCFFALVIAILFMSFLENITMQKREAEIKSRQAEAEVNLLKAQLQPHFLFNSFNNLYYDTYKALPGVAQRIAMLSDIMRYFLDESPKDRVCMGTEINFIQNYIELERVRLPATLELKVMIDCPENIMVPPMLFTPLVENLFKHGINQGSTTNRATITWSANGKQIQFSVENHLHPFTASNSGKGLHNLRERLNYIYPNQFELTAMSQGDMFYSQLIIPIV